jgi:hypothetical protein
VKEARVIAMIHMAASLLYGAESPVCPSVRGKPGKVHEALQQKMEEKMEK